MLIYAFPSLYSMTFQHLETCYWRPLQSSFLPTEQGDTVLGRCDNNATRNESLVRLEGGEDGGSLRRIQQKAHSQTKRAAEKVIGMSFRKKSEEVVDAFVSKQQAHLLLQGHG